MAKVTILSAGLVKAHRLEFEGGSFTRKTSIIGMAIASQLPTNYDVTIVARNLPGDPETTEWASQPTARHLTDLGAISFVSV